MPHQQMLRMLNVLVVVVIVGSGAAHAGQEGADTDRAALVALYEATDGPN